MTKRRTTRSASKAVTTPPLVRLWILRIGVVLGGHRTFVSRNGFSDDDIAVLLGLGKWIDPVDFDFDAKTVRVALRSMHEWTEKKHARAGAPACLRKNVQRLASLVGLSAVDCQILEFAVLIHSDHRLANAAEWLGALTSARALQVIAAVIGLGAAELRAALSGEGALARSGLVAMDHSRERSLRHKIDLLSDRFADQMTSAVADPVQLLRDTVIPAAPPDLGLKDYLHIQPSLSVLVPYLRKAQSIGRRGVNIYMHGDPGTGKSQLAKVIAKELELRLFEVSSEDSEGDPVCGQRRMQAFRSAQSFLSQSRAMLVFDEAEDIFGAGATLLGRESTAQMHKAWVNRTLETNPVPTLWLSNSIGDLDPAFIRRFDIVFEVPIPPRTQRTRIIREACAGLLDDAGLSRFAESEMLAPAVIARSASVVEVLRDQIPREQAAAAFEMLVSNTLEAQGHRALRRHDVPATSELYNPAFVHADADMASIAAGLAQARSGRLCLNGPPGTGKTAFGHWLADQMNLPLVVKRASDLLSKWVGENEKNIARVFRQAEEECAVLLIDEVDSFLRDRRGADRGWEVSLVNELLTQMETFGGVFIATTNLMDGLDHAALRRFDLKVKFDFLRPDQAGALFDRYCAQLELPAACAEASTRVRRLQNLTPGDFAVVARQHRFRRFGSTRDLLSALEAECTIKSNGRTTIGFM